MKNGIQLLLKPEDENRLIGPSKRGRSYKAISDKVITKMLEGWKPTPKKESERMNRVQFRLPDPVRKALKKMSEDSGKSECEIVREMLDLNY